MLDANGRACGRKPAWTNRLRCDDDNDDYLDADTVIWYVAVGSAIGGASRYALGLALQQRFGPGFPISTLVINVTGSLILGFLIRAVVDLTVFTPGIRALLTVGFCGGYTTFSTFSYDTALLLERGEYGRAALYIMLSVSLAIAATFVGFAMAQSMLTVRDRP